MPWGAAAAAVGSLGSAYLNSKNRSTGGSTTSDSPETQSAVNSALGKAETISDRGYTPYGGQVVQPLSQNEQTAVGMAGPDSAAGKKSSSLLDQAAGDISGIKQYNSANLKSYMDPYVQSVLDPVLNQENIRYNQQRSALLNSKAGAFGGDRSALEEGQLEYQHGQNIQSAVANANSAAFTNAQSAFFKDQQKQLDTANALEQNAGDVSKLNTSQMQDLMATGGLQRALGQSQLDFNLKQFLEQRDWSVSNLQPLLDTIAAAKGVSRTTSNFGPPANPAGQAIGAAATIAGAYFTGGKSAGFGQQDANNLDAQATSTVNDYSNNFQLEPVSP